MHLIENDYLKVQINEIGAELRSIWCKKKCREYLWQRNAKYWAKSSPVLFPFVGELNGGKFHYNGRTYYVPKHGFARDRLFQVCKHDASSVYLMLESGEETFAMYPFHFEFTISYTLQGRSLLCQYEVVNKGAEPMYFSVGAHPAFALEITNDQCYSDYFLSFPDDHSLKRYFLENNLLTRHYNIVPLDENKLVLDDDMFNQDAWVLKGLNSSQVMLQNQNGNYRIALNFNSFEYFGLWAPPGAPFICLEPWSGVNDSVSHRGHIEQKEGIVELRGMTHWKRNWSIQTF
ncbi:aldose 1-epimerase family protein [Sphingobacterium shayense]|uniref:aldose 1-epimerase family protein n=1 Tax=Sphingobacterium shayense TaxID=626343 RepID=UPI0015554D62|nr:aldose 1-epimerase family protein [Sphingobacterium shayense]NQD69280.1 aldose 1-epimerase family protein [Sphingobacterium shayense]